MTNLFFQNLPVYYINLDSRPDRDQYVKSHFAKNNIVSYTRISAIDGSIHNPYSRLLSNAQYGCTASHIKALKEFYDSGQEYGFICEDDIDLSNSQKLSFNFLDTLKYFNSEHYCLQTSVSTRTDLPFTINFKSRSFWDFATVSYIVNRAYAKKLIDAYTVDGAVNLNSFERKIVRDYRSGGQIRTKPVADELVYSLCETKVIPLFTFIDTESSILNNNESLAQVEYSILEFYRYWSKFDTIKISDIFLEA